MVKIVLTPQWFLGTDVFIEAFSLLVLLTFTFLAFRYYRINKNKNILHLGTGFAFISVAQIADLLTKLVLFYDIGPSRIIGEALINSQVVASVDIFYYMGFFFYRLLTLLGLYIIYRLPQEKKNSAGDYVLMVYFILISALLGDELYYIFYITALILLILIVDGYYEVYKKNKFPNTKILIIAFSLLALSHLICVLSDINLMYVLGDVVELISYTIFLGLIIRIWIHGKEKKQDEHHIRYAGDSARKRRKH